MTYNEARELVDDAARRAQEAARAALTDYVAQTSGAFAGRRAARRTTLEHQLTDDQAALSAELRQLRTELAELHETLRQRTDELAGTEANGDGTQAIERELGNRGRRPHPL
ncbi:MAG TPA: hypothetical protein VE780_10880 [Thermoleophilaceae bacterium]|nr:hypothetical protein [Thermoleophilaceae bacterium]